MLKSFPKPLIGDWLVISAGLALVVTLFATFWKPEHAAKLRIRSGDKVVSVLSLNQQRSIDIRGPLGISHIVIEHGRVRFAHSPCRNQYCVHQGWLQHDGQVAVCLPNQVSIELFGTEKQYDSLNY